MSSSILQLFGFSLIPVVAMAGAGAYAAFRPPSAAWRSAIMHFAAGVVFAVVAVELLPDITHEHAVGITAAGFALGTAVMLGLRSLTRGAEKGEASEGGVPTALLAATGVDIAVDGLMLGVGFAAGAKEGMLLFLVTEELLVEAHEVNETPLLTSTFFLGFLLFLLLEMLQ